MRNPKTLYITQAAIIAALYVVLCVALAPFSYGNVQIRVAEALTILPLFTPAAIPGLVIGCLLSNIIGGGIILDVVFGTFATFIGAVGTYLLRDKARVLAPIPPIVANAIIVPFVLYYGYGTQLPIPLMMLTVGLGEVAGCGILGLLLAKAIDKVNIDFVKPKQLRNKLDNEQ